MARDKEKERERNRKYREQNREKIRERDRAFYHANRESRLQNNKFNAAGEKRSASRKSRITQREWKKKQYDKVRTELLEFFGKKCVRCGFDDVRALCVDHINGGGTQERKLWQNKNKIYYYKSIIEKNGEGYQLLCQNCNTIKRIEEKEHIKPYIWV